MAEPKYKALVCHQCGIEFLSPRKKLYCNIQCCRTAQDRRKGHRPRAVYDAERRAPANWFKCEQCGIDAHRELSGGNKGPNRFCSMACRLASQAAQRAERMAALEMHRAAIAAERQARKMLALAAVVVKPPRTCVCLVCSKVVEYRFGRPRLYCSGDCAKATAQAIEGRKSYKKKRRAVCRGAFAESFSALSIFERDGWRCQICGTSTPKTRRGTRHANAPELDHVVPLSKGGAHTRANTQCSCRSCNQWKSDRYVVGQVGLFTSLQG